MPRTPSTTCRHGHPMKGRNLILHKRGDKTTRECRTCANDRYRAKRAARKRNQLLLSGGSAA